MTAPAQVSPCRWCARPVVRPPYSDTWRHTDGDVGCRDVWRWAFTGNTAAPRPVTVPAEGAVRADRYAGRGRSANDVRRSGRWPR